MDKKVNWRRTPIGVADGAWRVLDDNSCVAESGRAVFLPIDRFRREIIESDNCFLCGLPESESKPFDYEHVIPDWVVTRFKLTGHRVRLPNATLADTYDKYTIPCCKDCNRLLGKEMEKEISGMTVGGYRALINRVEAEGDAALHRLFTWISLVYFKVHYRDRKYREHRDPRKGDGYVSDRYDWDTFHHVYCMARSVLTGAEIAPTVFGSLLILQTEDATGVQGFDYIDDSEEKVVFIRLGDLALLAVLNDGQHVKPYLQGLLEGAQQLYPMDLLGIIAQAMFHNHYLINRPTYESRYDPSSRAHFITAKSTGPVAFGRPDYTFLGDKLIQMLEQRDLLTNGTEKRIREMCSHLAATMDR